MTLSIPAFDQFVQSITELQARVVETQREKLMTIAARMAGVIQNDGRIFLFGTGHSHMLVEEGAYRAGGLANVIPILSEHFMLHRLPDLGSRLERTPDLADMILDRYAPEAGEMLFVYSNSGVNRLPVEMALHAHQRGLFVVGVSSFAYARQAPLSDLSLRLDQAADLALDNGGIPGDAIVELPESPWRVAPTSTIIGALLWNCIVSEASRLLLVAGMQPPVFVSLNVKGAAEHNQALLDKWRPRNIHL